MDETGGHYTKWTKPEKEKYNTISIVRNLKKKKKKKSLREWTSSRGILTHWTCEPEDGKGSPACRSPWGRKDLDMTEWLTQLRRMELTSIPLKKKLNMCGDGSVT